ncbi:MAG TPA: tRNA (adenosine(37)-N6)-threonylcarbamoyltransferase complex dimerization subunit type 1 TsaB [Actinomycetota bacterium]|nr:tRNA (adenosine(37)-N6)-threonylcarbamoyltransferase complex dimerization subunit type 1 TsaB [Actinomycetota bacterium]
MLVLGIETSTPQASVALGSATELVGAYQLGRFRSQDQILVPAIERLLEDAGLTYKQVHGIAVGIGPGLFTGLRVGVSTAKALAQTLAVPAVGLSSMDVLAYNVRHSRRTICTCVDARRGEVYWAFYRPMPGGVQRMTEFRCARPEHCVNEIEARSEPVLAVGNGPLVYRSMFDSADLGIEIAGMTDSTPTAVPLTELAVRLFEREESDRLADLRPLYIRKSDAELNWERMGR